MIHVDHFRWQFAGSPAPALDDVSLHIKRGEFVALIGPSGSGKSTLAMAICGLLLNRQAGTAAGRITVADHDVATTPLHRIAETIGLVQQNPEAQFATLTVADEVAFGLENRCRTPAEIETSVAAALDLLDIAHLRDRTLATLSGGEQQRVAVASLVAGNPAALVLDEPTASLDPAASRLLFAALARVCRERDLTVIIIEHKLSQLLPHGPRLIALESGRLVAADARVGCSAVCEPVATPPTSQQLIHVQNVDVHYAAQPILREISLQVRTGEIIGLLGPNGGGKTTLLHTLMGLVKPTRGTVRVCDLDVTPAAVSRLARDVGLVFQNADHQLVADHVWDEAVFAPRRLGRLDENITQQAETLLQKAGLADRKDDHPFRLSWGQKRRLNLISAVLHRPRLLLLDEPFAGQDWENVALLLDVIRAVLTPTDGACLLVTHDARIVQRICTRIVFIAAGRILVDAPTADAFERLLVLGHDAFLPPEFGADAIVGENPAPEGGC